MIILYECDAGNKSIIFIGPFQNSVDNYHAVDDSVLCVGTSAHGSVTHTATRCGKTANTPREPGVMPRTLLEVWVYITADWLKSGPGFVHFEFKGATNLYFKIFGYTLSLNLLPERSNIESKCIRKRIKDDYGMASSTPIWTRLTITIQHITVYKNKIFVFY